MEEINKIISETKEAVIKLKEEVQALDSQAMELGQEFQEANKKRDEIENKESAQYKLQDSISNEILEKLRGVNEKSQETKNKAIEKIEMAQSKCENKKEKLAQKILEDKNRKEKVSKEIEQFSELVRRDKEENNVPESDAIMQNRMKKILALRSELSTIDENYSESMELMSEIDSKIQFLNYDDIEKISIEKVEAEPEIKTEPKGNEEQKEEPQKQEKTPEEVKEMGDQIIQDMGNDYKNVRFDVPTMEGANGFYNREVGKFYNEGEELPGEQIEGLWIDEDEIKAKDYGIKIKISERDEMIQYTDNTGENKEISIAALYEEKKNMYKRLQIGKKCRETIKNVTGRRSLGLMLKRKINPEIIKTLDTTGNSDLIQDYIESIYSKKKLPFELTHDLSGLTIAEKLVMRKYTKAEEKCGAKILGKIFNRNKALPEGEKQVEKIEKEGRDQLAQNVREIMQKEEEVKENASFIQKVDGKNEEIAEKYNKEQENNNPTPTIEECLNVLNIRDSVKLDIANYANQYGEEAARKEFPGVFAQAQARISMRKTVEKAREENLPGNQQIAKQNEEESR